MADAMPPPAADDVAAAGRVRDAHQRIKAELRKAIVGLDPVIDELLISVFARGHCLLVGVPGLAKTLLISTLAKSLSLSLQPHPVHPRPDARRHHRHRGHPGGPGHRHPRS